MKGICINVEDERKARLMSFLGAHDIGITHFIKAAVDIIINSGLQSENSYITISDIIKKASTIKSEAYANRGVK